MEFELVQGDIAAQSADALVNAAGTSLEMGSGVAGALRRRAGEELNEAAVETGPIELGEVAVTDAYDLDADYVIHAAAMPHYGDGQATEASIRDATRNTLETADDLGCESIVLPALGCGMPGSILRTGLRLSLQWSVTTSQLPSRRSNLLPTATRSTRRFGPPQQPTPESSSLDRPTGHSPDDARNRCQRRHKCHSIVTCAVPPETETSYSPSASISISNVDSSSTVSSRMGPDNVPSSASSAASSSAESSRLLSGS